MFDFRRPNTNRYSHDSENRCGTSRYMHIYAYSDVYFNYSTMIWKHLVMAYVNFIKNYLLNRC